MNVRIVPAICLLGFGIMASAWVAVFGYQNFDWALHSSLSVLAALATSGYFSFAVATVWHGHQKEKIGKPNDKTYSSY